MRVTKSDIQALRERGIYLTDSCDRCGTLIHYANRFTRFHSKGAWCSRLCRDGVESRDYGTCRNCGQSLQGKRKGTLYCSDTCRMRDRNRKVLNGRNYPENAAHSKGLMGVGIGFGCPYTSGPQNGQKAQICEP
jgi:hypothetical protein